ncbi:MAG TPA: hypothetical protein VGC55_09840, partial [Dokdonella sp.]
MIEISRWGLRARTAAGVDDADGTGVPFWSLLYLAFLFANWAGAPLREWAPPTLLSVAVFLPLFLRACRRQGGHVLAYAAA